MMARSGGFNVPGRLLPLDEDAGAGARVATVAGDRAYR